MFAFTSSPKLRCGTNNFELTRTVSIHSVFPGAHSEQDAHESPQSVQIRKAGGINLHKGYLSFLISKQASRACNEWSSNRIFDCKDSWAFSLYSWPASPALKFQCLPVCGRKLSGTSRPLSEGISSPECGGRTSGGLSLVPDRTSPIPGRRKLYFGKVSSQIQDRNKRKCEII
jgi:hypothetical protein